MAVTHLERLKLPVVLGFSIMVDLPRLPRKPEARSLKVEELVDLVQRGVIRVPYFQRGLKWTREEVRELFDSVYRGYPVGSLLFYKRPAPAERLRVGPLVVDAPELAEGWWVVDGQQRLTSLAACLARPVPFPEPSDASDPYLLYFDAAEQGFWPPPFGAGQIPSTWVPLPFLLDATGLSEWIFSWRHGQDRDLRHTVFDAGTRIREYPIPLYLIEAGDDKVAEEIFYRVNQAGKPLRWEEIHKALFGDAGRSPSTLDDLAEGLVDVGMGRLEENRLLTNLIALRGQDPTRTLAEHVRRDREVLQGAVKEALPVLRRVLSFLRRDAGIPHLRLLPKSILLDVLTRFFALHEEPRPRTRRLLARWFWRTVLGAGMYDDRTVRRSGIKAVVDDEEKSVQGLLALVRPERPRALELPAKFDARADASRIALLALVDLEPRHLISGQPLDVAGLLEEQAKDAFSRILKTGGGKKAQSPANRLIQPRGTPVRKALVNRIRSEGADDRVVASHGLTPQAAERLAAGDVEGFLDRRSTELTQRVQLFAERWAEWDQNDRPSVDHLLASAGVEL